MPGARGLGEGFEAAASVPAGDHRRPSDQQHALALLVEHLADAGDEPAVGVLGGGSGPHHAEACPKRVSRPHRLEPAELVDTARSEARHVMKERAHEQAHEERGRVPAAGDQAAVDRGLGRFPVYVERLRIETAGEVQDLLLADGFFTQLEHLAFLEVFQMAHRQPPPPIISSYPRPRYSSKQKPLPNGSARMAKRPQLWPSLRPGVSPSASR